MSINSKIPFGPISQKWTKHKFDLKLVNPSNKRKYDIIVVGTGLAGGSAAATLAELGYNVKAFSYHESPRRAHSIAAQGGINAAKKAGMKIKINTVALKGINDNEILNLVNWCGENKFGLTFIEVMPMGEIGENRANQYMPLTDVKSLIQTKYSLSDDPLKTGGPARYVHCHETDQKIGFITPHTHNFCESCNRVRITCTGEMYMCLGQQDKADLKTPLRKSKNNDFLKETIYEAISRKPKGHDFVIERKKDEKFVPRHMSVTGG